MYTQVTGKIFSYLLIAVLGCMAALITCMAGEIQLKWFVVFLLGIFLSTLFAIYPEKRKFLLSAFVFFLPIFVTKKFHYSDYQLIAGGPASIGIFLYDIPLIFLFFLFVGEKLKGSNKMFISPVVWPFAIYIVWSLITIVNAAEPELTMIEFIFLAKLWLILVLLPNWIKDRKDLILVLATFTAGLFIQEVMTFLQWHYKTWFTFTGDVEYTTLQTTIRPETFRAGGTVGWHNIQAAYYELLIPVILGFSLGLANKKVRIVILIVIMGALTALTLTYSRNGYISTAIAFILFAVVANYKRLLNARHFFLIFSMMIIGILLIGAMPAGKIMFERIKSEAAIEPRVETMQIALNMIKEHPIAGIGLNNFSIVMDQRAYSPNGISDVQQGYIGGEFFRLVVHNKFLLIASQTGLVGLGLFIWIIVLVFSHSWNLARHSQRLFAGLGIGFLSAFGGSLVNMMFDIYNSDLLITIFWVLVGLVFAAERIMYMEKDLMPV
jgi:putative inorganic carbon (HCO3(-)) transporter